MVVLLAIIIMTATLLRPPEKPSNCDQQLQERGHPQGARHASAGLIRLTTDDTPYE